MQNNHDLLIYIIRPGTHIHSHTWWPLWLLIRLKIKLYFYF